jgi:uncharacterized alkaline shock family protein YloU
MTELANGGVPGPFPTPRTDLSTAEPGRRADPGHRAPDTFERDPAPAVPPLPLPSRVPPAGPTVTSVTPPPLPRVPVQPAGSADRTTDRGTTIIADEVVEKIVGIAAREVPGVYDLGGDVSRVFATVKERIGLGRPDGDEGVSVRLDGTKATVKVTLVIEYGFVVYSVTDSVRAEVIGAVEKMLGLEVTAVDIVVDDIHVPDA